MTHSTLCFLCKAQASDPGDLCQTCETRIGILHLQAEADLPAPQPIQQSPMREFVNSVMRPVFGGPR